VPTRRAWTRIGVQSSGRGLEKTPPQTDETRCFRQQSLKPKRPATNLGSGRNSNTLFLQQPIAPNRQEKNRIGHRFLPIVPNSVPNSVPFNRRVCPATRATAARVDGCRGAWTRSARPLRTGARPRARASVQDRARRVQGVVPGGASCPMSAYPSSSGRKAVFSPISDSPRSGRAGGLRAATMTHVDDPHSHAPWTAIGSTDLAWRTTDAAA
jgi:hypothetical protein